MSSLLIQTRLVTAELYVVSKQMCLKKAVILGSNFQPLTFPLTVLEISTFSYFHIIIISIVLAWCKKEY